jgi:RNA polymerase sigma factor (sigma-70 family)
VDDNEWLAERFETHRTHLRSVAYRMLGSQTEADDAVQESWLRLSRTDTSEVQNLGGWLTTVVARVCLDMLRSRTSRREDPLDAAGESDAPVGVVAGVVDPEREALLADSVGLALLVVLDTLGPAERLAFVLHDMFGVPFDEIATIVGRSPNATKMMASRARRRVQDASRPEAAGSGAGRRREIVAAFLAASRDGDFEALLALLDPDVVLRSDDAAAAMGGGDAEVIGASGVAAAFAGRARAARLVLVDGVPALVWSLRGETRVVFGFEIEDGRIVEIHLSADPAYLAGISVESIHKGQG